MCISHVSNSHSMEGLISFLSFISVLLQKSMNLSCWSLRISTSESESYVPVRADSSRRVCVSLMMRNIRRKSASYRSSVGSDMFSSMSVLSFTSVTSNPRSSRSAYCLMDFTSAGVTLLKVSLSAPPR